MIQPPALPPKPVRPRPSWTRLSANPDVRSVQIAVVATIVLHLLLLWLAPRIESFVGREDMGRTPTEADRTFEIQLAPDIVSPPPKPPPIKFVEANPNAPDNVPDKTDNFAAQNQQVAQEKPTPDHKSDAPAVKGENDPNNTAIVTGQLAEPALATPPAQKPVEKTETPEQAIARKAQSPLSGTEKIEGDNPDGLGSNVTKVSPAAKPSPEMIEGDANAKSLQGKTHGLYYTVDAKHPQPRPTLSASLVKARSTPLKNNEFGTYNIGISAYDAKWSSYGEYLQRFIETVQVQWERIIEQSNIYPTAGTKVTVTFQMDSTGGITGFTKVEGSGGHAATESCTSAIIARKTYGAWTDDMIAALGKSTEFTFTFVYE